jgi:hypothetical protein
MKRPHVRRRLPRVPGAATPSTADELALVVVRGAGAVDGIGRACPVATTARPAIDRAVHLRHPRRPAPNGNHRETVRCRGSVSCGCEEIQ